MENHMAYTYLLTHVKSKRLYYGVRFDKRANPAELWVTYFSSSKIVKELIEEDGLDAFTYEVRKVFDDPEKALAWEAKVLSRLNAADSPIWLNRFNGGKSFKSPSYHSKETKAKISKTLKGRSMSSEHRSKIACKSTWANKVSPEARARATKKLKGRPRTPEMVAKMAITKTGTRRVYQPDGSYKYLKI